MSNTDSTVNIVSVASKNTPVKKRISLANLKIPMMSPRDAINFNIHSARNPKEHSDLLEQAKPSLFARVPDIFNK